LAIVNRILDWVERHLPGLLLAFGIGFREGTKKNDELEKKLIEEETKRKLLENEVRVEKEYSNKSSSDVVNELVGRDARPESSKPKS